MKISEADDLRKGVERVILKAIKDFEKRTGLVVESIDLEHSRKIGDEKPRTKIVSLRVAL
jgi:hypothetical protein